jgi:uroporphyrinogen-III synthase
MTTLAVTREARQLEPLVALAATRGITILPLPLTKQKAVLFAWPDDLDINRIDWLLFTSANGVRFFFDRINQLQCAVSNHTKFGAVGKATADAIRAIGFEPTFVSEETRGDAMFAQLIESEINEGYLALWARAETVVTDPTELMQKRGILFRSIICYATESQPVDDSHTQLTENDAILFTAPSAVNSFASQIGTPVARMIAIGEVTANAIKALGWSDPVIMNHADINSVLEYI